MLKRFVAYYKPHKAIFAGDMICSFLIALVGMGYPVITRYMLNEWIPKEKIDLVIVGAISLLAIYVLRMLLRYFVQYYGHVMGVRMQGQMRSDLFDKLQRLPYSYFDTHETGTVMSTMTNDLFDVAELAHHGPENIFIAGFTLIGAFVYLMIIDWILGLVLLAVIPFVFGITWYFRKKFRKYMRESKKAIAKINAQVESSVSGIRVTKAFTNQDIEKEKFEKANNGYIAARTGVFSAMGAFFATSQFVTDFFNVVVLLLGGILLYKHTINPGDYSAFIVSVSLFISPINQLIAFIEQFESASSGFERFLSVLDEEEETIKQGDEVLKSVEGAISFDDVSFAYNDKDGEVLKNVSFSIKKGETLALVGPSGGGKTTICHLIPRFYFLEHGSISIDGNDISKYTLPSLRDKIGIVQQDVFLFSGSIRENILYGKPNASEEEIVEAAKRANIYEYIQSLPDGWDTQIGERGVRLSGGQKQRLSIARVFLKNPPILILDEATSALDNTTEMLIQTALNELAEGRTCIVVAHRLSTIKNADTIAVISNGEIKEMGSHEELIKAGGTYKQLYELQFKNGKSERMLDIEIG